MQKNKEQTTANWFDSGGKEYVKYRPAYPARLAAELADCCTDRALAVDIACGNGQLTGLLASYFQQVVGIDPSQDQIDNAGQYARVKYICAPAEQLPKLASVNLVTVAQAAHWLDLPRFYNEVKKLAAPGCVLAFISYGTVNVDADLKGCFTDFYKNRIYKFWTFDRDLVDGGYAKLVLPFTVIPGRRLSIEYEWDYQMFMGYINTWSAVKNAVSLGHADIVADFAAALSRAWGDKSIRRKFIWPVYARLARL